MFQGLIEQVNSIEVREPLSRIYSGVVYEFDMKTLQINSGDDHIERLLTEADLAKHNADSILYTEISATLKEWGPLKLGEERVAVEATRGRQKDALLERCDGLRPELAALLLRLEAGRDEVEAIDSIAARFDEKIAMLRGRHGRIPEFRSKVARQPLIAV